MEIYALIGLCTFAYLIGKANDPRFRGSSVLSTYLLCSFLVSVVWPTLFGFLLYGIYKGITQ
jgi:hypothetical protein